MSKNTRFFLIGLIIGCMLMLSSGALAAVGKTVSAIADAYISFEFDGEKKELPEGYTVLLYEGRTYVPSRFVAESLGADVEWVASARTVRITSPKSLPLPEEGPEPGEPADEEAIEPEPGEPETEEEPVQPKGNYREVPVTAYYKDMRLTAYLVMLERGHTRVYIELENKDAPPLQLLQGETVAVVDGKEYCTDDVPFYLRDERWYGDVRAEETLEGYLALPVIDEDAKEMKLIVTVLNNDWTQSTRKVELDLALDVQVGDI